MSDDMRDFVDRRTREGGFSTPTEYLRALIREDRRRSDDGAVSLLEKWLAGAELSPEEERSLPPGALRAAQDRLEKILLLALERVQSKPMAAEDWESLRVRARERLAERTSEKT